MGKHYEEYLKQKKEREKSEKRKLKKWDEKNFLSLIFLEKIFHMQLWGGVNF